MSQEIKIPIQFAYMGGRNYITTSQITNADIDFAKPWLDVASCQNLQLKMFRPILYHCSLVLEPVTKSIKLPDNLVAEFHCEVEGQNHRAHIVEGGERILEHKDEAPVDLPQYVRFSGRHAKVFQRIPHYTFIEVYVQTGKELILTNTSSTAPRVAGFAIKRVPSYEELPFLEIMLEERVRNGFVRLAVFAGKDHLGYTTVHL